MKKLTAAVKQMLDALAAEHAGEFLSLSDKSQILGDKQNSIRPVARVQNSAESGKLSNARRVALYMGSELPAEVMDYVIETCSRLNHELTVLTFQPENTSLALLSPYKQALKTAGVEMKLETLAGEVMSGLGRYLRGRPEVAFLACKESGYLGRSYLKGIQRKNALPVPVVVVATNDMGKAELGQEMEADDRNQSATA